MSRDDDTTEQSGTLVDLAVRVLLTPDPFQKAALTEQIALRWQSGGIQLAYDPAGENNLAPDKPARDDRVSVVEPGRVPRLGKGGTLASRQAIIHSLVHIESWAVDLSWDIIARFGKQREMPREFFDDFVSVAQEEAKHFTLLNERLEQMGSNYGSLAAHDGLWESASETADSLEARLAVEHCVHEARGLDVLPQTIRRLRGGGDQDSADLLWNIIYKEEITHCAVGLKWFRHLHGSEADAQDVVASFHECVRKHFKGILKPPFNEEARRAAGFGPEWYLPLAIKPILESEEKQSEKQEEIFEENCKVAYAERCEEAVENIQLI